MGRVDQPPEAGFARREAHRRDLGGTAKKGAHGGNTVSPVPSRSRTDRAVGYTTALVLKTSWATGPLPLRGKRNPVVTSWCLGDPPPEAGFARWEARYGSLGALQRRGLTGETRFPPCSEPWVTRPHWF